MTLAYAFTDTFGGSFAGNAVEGAPSGTIAAEQSDPGVVAVMAELGIDISAARPKLLAPAVVARRPHYHDGVRRGKLWREASRTADR